MRLTYLLIAGTALTIAPAAEASDHLDTRTVIADPRADIGDIYAWMSPDARRLNLVMAIVGHSFAPELSYSFHIDSGPAFGATTRTVTIRCRFRSRTLAECDGAGDRASGNASRVEGIESRGGHYRLFAGLRDDPFFNNVKGSREAYQVALKAIRAGVPSDAAGCPQLGAATSQKLLDEWRHTDGGAATNFLAGWTPAAIVLSVDIREVTDGGPMLAIWGTTAKGRRQLDRMGRPLTGNAMLAPLAPDEVSDRLKEGYNAATPATSARFVPEIEKTLGLYDSFDGRCGNGWMAGGTPGRRYRRAAELLADDRLWVNSGAGRCVRFLAVELGDAGDCGGRTLTEDAVDVYRSLLATGAETGITDGVDRDERETLPGFPFLAGP